MISGGGERKAKQDQRKKASKKGKMKASSPLFFFFKKINLSIHMSPKVLLTSFPKLSCLIPFEFGVDIWCLMKRCFASSCPPTVSNHLPPKAQPVTHFHTYFIFIHNIYLTIKKNHQLMIKVLYSIRQESIQGDNRPKL